MRGWLPREVGAKTWFAADDAATAIFMPIYNNILEAPLCLRVGNGDMLTFSWTSAFWMTNWVANQCYSRYEDMKVDVDRVRNEIMDRWDAETDSIDAQAVALLKNSTSDVTAFLNEYTARESNGATEAYKELGIYLLVNISTAISSRRRMASLHALLMAWLIVLSNLNTARSSIVL